MGEQLMGEPTIGEQLMGVALSGDIVLGEAMFKNLEHTELN